MDSARSGAVTDGCSCKASSNGPRGIPGATVGVAVAGEARTTHEVEPRTCQTTKHAPGVMCVLVLLCQETVSDLPGGPPVLQRGLA